MEKFEPRVSRKSAYELLKQQIEGNHLNKVSECSTCLYNFSGREWKTNIQLMYRI